MGNKKEGKQGKKLGLKGGLVITVACLLAVMFIPVAVVLIVGMAPTIVAGMIDKTPQKLKVVTVGFMNFAGCYPYLLTLIARHGNDPGFAFNIVFQPLNIVIMYFAAAMGYLIEYGVTRAVAAMLVQGAEKRVKDIAEEQKEMRDRWGDEVTGDIPLDAYGFPIKQEEQEGKEKQAVS